MNHQGNGQPITFQITIPGPVAVQIKEEQQRTTLDGRGDDFLNAIKHAVERLHRDPLRFGEAIFPLSHVQAVVHLAFRPPLVIEFAIHEKHKVVALRRVRFVPPS